MLSQYLAVGSSSSRRQVESQRSGRFSLNRLYNQAHSRFGVPKHLLRQALHHPDFHALNVLFLPEHWHGRVCLADYQSIWRRLRSFKSLPHEKCIQQATVCQFHRLSPEEACRSRRLRDSRLPPEAHRVLLAQIFRGWFDIFFYSYLIIVFLLPWLNTVYRIVRFSIAIKKQT